MERSLNRNYIKQTLNKPHKPSWTQHVSLLISSFNIPAEHSKTQTKSEYKYQCPASDFKSIHIKTIQVNIKIYLLTFRCYIATFRLWDFIDEVVRPKDILHYKNVLHIKLKIWIVNSRYGLFEENKTV